MIAARIVGALLCIATCASSLPVQARAEDRTFEDASITFILKYMQEWSSPNASALAYMNRVFPNSAIYFDHTLTHEQLMRAKRRFAERWPLRRFLVRRGDLSVVCNARHLCTVWGLVDWRCESPERNAVARGTSVFEFQLQDAQTVVDEDGFVIARGQVLPHYSQAVPNAPIVYSNADIPKLRQSFYDDSRDRNWIASWLATQRPFAGIARSPGNAGLRELSLDDATSMPYAIFQTDQGPIACMMAAKVPLRPPGAPVNLRGTVSIFIDRTMYLSHCSFG
jgi:hypothetical protein